MVLKCQNTMKDICMNRLYYAAIIEHIQEDHQMLFLMGPRQVGKTTTCNSLSKKYKYFFYFSWDNLNDREKILIGPKAIVEVVGLESLMDCKPIIVFDEIHKYSDWKNFLKGFYDSYFNKASILVTGSARLDIYKKGGDSLMGRYFLYRFHPLSVGEIVDQTFPNTEVRLNPIAISETDFDTLWQYGGYPDPFIKANKRFFNRWSNLRFQQLFQEDIRDLTRIQEIKQLEVLANLLKFQVGMQTSYESLAKKVRVTGHTIRNWIEALRSLYYCFEIRPWSKNISRSLLKEPKYYLWDWAQIEDLGARAENFVASHLLKSIHFWTDAGFGCYDLYYIRDKDQREVDFLVTRNDEPWLLIEVKLSSNKAISPALSYFQQVTGAKHAFQVVIDLPWVNRNCFEETRPIIVPAKTFLSQLI
ncbi:Uncharacterized protein PRO82_002009 [Candidatus Protochlamydia amoebophila]|nr:Uncharacterized protein [Candidatus Protochlamydia amoebophila]